MTHRAAKDVRAIEWSVVEHASQRRWWWIAGVTCLGVAGVVLLAIDGVWTASALVAITTIALVVDAIQGSRKASVRLTEEELVVNGQSFALANFRAFRLDDLASVVLIPRAALALHVVVPLSGDSSKDARSLLRLADRLEYVETPDNALDQIVEWGRTR